MRITINIPKEFEQHWYQDRFEDSLHRLSADAHLLAGNYEQETAKMLIEAFKHADKHPEIIYCGECKNMEVDDIYHDCWCNGKKVFINHYCGYAERRKE